MRLSTNISPITRPPVTISISSALIFPRTTPLTKTFCAKISPRITPLLPIETVLDDCIVPSISPSTWRFDSSVKSPLIIARSEMTEVSFATSLLGWPLSKIPMVHAFLFSLFYKNFVHSIE